MRIRASDNPKYVDEREQARGNMLIALRKIVGVLEEGVAPDVRRTLNNLVASRDAAIPGLLCFDDIWETCERIVIAMQNDYHSCEGESFKKRLQEFKDLIFRMMAAGIPIETNKNINFWSTKFSRFEAERYAKETGTMTDTLASEYYRKIFLEWPEEKLTMLKPIFKRDLQIAQVFWSAISDIYLQNAPYGTEVHVFVQDAITQNNYFWNMELPFAREKQMKIFIHVFDIEQRKWLDPVDLDSKEGDKLFIRRRNTHHHDKNINREDVYYGPREDLWKMEYIEGLTSHLTFWSAPKQITFGKLRKICKKMIDVHRNKNRK